MSYSVGLKLQGLKKSHIKYETVLPTFKAFTISFILHLNVSFSFNETGLYCSNDLLSLSSRSMAYIIKI